MPTEGAPIPHRILLVMDETPACRVVQQLLATTHFEVVVVPTTVDASRQLRCARDPLALAIVDLQLPGEGARAIVEMARRLAHRNELPFLALSSVEGGRDLPDALAIGCDAYVAKAFVTSELLSVVQDMLPSKTAAERTAHRIA